MKKNCPEILQLRRDIEESVSRHINTPTDFEFLVGVIWERTKTPISPTTLKRLWGYIDGADNTRQCTLDLLSKALGFADWEDYTANLEAKSPIQSDFLCAPHICSSDLKAGDIIEITWMPNRVCEIKYSGDNKFVIIRSENSKLCVGDTFSCSFFITGQPLYLEELHHKQGPAMAYVIGKKDGLISVKKL